MKIVVYYGNDNKISWVKTFNFYKREKGWSPKEVEKKVKECNDKNGKECAVIMEFDRKLDDVVNFIFGEKQFRIYSDIDDLDDSINELSTDLSSIQSDIFDMSRNMEHIETMFNEFKEKLNQKGYYGK